MAQRWGWEKRLGLSLVLVAAMAGLSLVHAQEKISVRMDFLPAGTHAPFHLAAAKGWYREAGLDVDIQDGRGSINTIQLVGAGQADFGWVSQGPMAIAREQGMRLKSVAGIFRKGDLAVLVDDKSGWKTPKDLAGKRIVVFTASPWAPFIDPFFKSAGMTRNDVNLVFVDPTSMFPNYASGQSDAVMTVGPFALPIVNINRPSRAILAADNGIQLPSYGIITREEIIAGKAPTVQRFVSVTLRAFDYIYGGREGEGADAVIAARTGVKLDRNVILTQINLYKAFIHTDNSQGQRTGWQSERDWEMAIKSMEAANVIKPGKKPDEFFTNQFVK